MKYVGSSLVAICALVMLLLSLPMTGVHSIHGAGTETTEDVFRVRAVDGMIGEERFNSMAELEALLNTPIVGDTVVEVNVTLQLRQSAPKYVSFLRLRSGLTNVTWDATPARLKGVVVWSYEGEETYMWVPPSHDALEMTISLSGSMAQPIAHTTFMTDEGATIQRALIQDTVTELLLVEVRASRATFEYTSDPWAWVKNSVSESRTLRVEGVATSNLIKQAKTEIQGMEQILAMLEGADVQNRLAQMPDEIGPILKALVADVRDLVDSGASTIDAGYPDIFLLEADIIRGAAEHTADIVTRIKGIEEYENAIASKDERIGVLESRLGSARRNTMILGVSTGVFLVGTMAFFVMWRGTRRRLGDYLKG